MESKKCRGLQRENERVMQKWGEGTNKSGEGPASPREMHRGAATGKEPHGETNRQRVKQREVTRQQVTCVVRRRAAEPARVIQSIAQ